MGDELLPYYNEELAFVRDMAAEFADAHPKIAGRLRLSGETIEDPHVARLIEAFAYLNARTRHKLDDDFPELTEALLGVLYPHYLAPIPSMAIAQFTAAPDLKAASNVPRHTEIETEPVDGEPCRFRSCYPVQLWPLEVESAEIGAPMLAAGPELLSRDTDAMLRLVLTTAAEDTKIGELGLDRLRFFLKGQSQHVYPLYELLLNDALQIAVADSPLDKNPRLLDKSAIRPVGFELDEGMLPYPAQSFPGYRLLSEYFAFPQKFLFFELAGLERALRRAGPRTEIYIFFRRSAPELERSVDRETFALGCTPIVNLFERRADPINLDQTVNEYPVIPDARRIKASEVYTVDNLSVTGTDGRKQQYLPFYGTTHGGPQSERRFWKTTRRNAGTANPGTEVSISLIDLDLNPAAHSNAVANIQITCLNRDLPARLPFGGGQPRLRLSEGGAGIESVIALTAPTDTLRPPLRQGALWRLMSHLTLNHLSISGDAEGAKALKEILTLYDFRDSAETRAMIEGVESVSSSPVTARVRRGKRSALAHGIEVTVELDPRRFSGSNAYLFASVLERFFALYTSINSFTRTAATIKGREGTLCTWPPRAGERILL